MPSSAGSVVIVVGQGTFVSEGQITLVDGVSISGGFSGIIALLLG